ncbi:MAG: hypothetical protein GDA68_02740 [Nitrospira sp. CR2.1]|nr:hypothetical protein [Nitrospira sp. CR2.1]MBA5876196.1 hypothetical protein [Nitrospira sp. CR1.2]
MSSILSSRAIKVILLLVGVVTLGGLVVHIGPERIYRAGMRLGAVGLTVMLVPSTVMYVLDCLGWQLTLGRHRAAVPFSTIAQIVYILLGIGLGIWVLVPSAPADHLSGVAATISLGLLLFATVMFIVIQRRGLFTLLFRGLEKYRIRVTALEARREKFLGSINRSWSFTPAIERPFFSLPARSSVAGWWKPWRSM